VDRLERVGRRHRAQHLDERGSGFVWGGRDRTEPLRRAVGGPGLDVLDLGCRDGALSSELVRGNHVVGLDADRDTLADAARAGLETVWADAEEPLPFADASFDVVLAGEILEHLRDPHALVAEAARVLRPGGRFVGSVPNAYRLKNRLRFLAGRAPEQNPTHLHLFSPADVLDLLRAYEEPQLEFAVGRFVRLGPRLFANVIVFSAAKPTLLPA